MTANRKVPDTRLKRCVDFVAIRIPVYGGLGKFLWMAFDLLVRALIYRKEVKTNPRIRLAIFHRLIRLECQALSLGVQEDEDKRDAWRRMSMYSAVRAQALRECGGTADERKTEEHWASKSARIARHIEAKIRRSGAASCRARGVP
ncbi:MAG: hypothetical protein IPK07_25815 [Deltaproteobacteria bacterium]|nr:hypothetical protein [Deltaproteobacteria bacterium]